MKKVKDGTGKAQRKRPKMMFCIREKPMKRRTIKVRKVKMKQTQMKEMQ